MKSSEAAVALIKRFAILNFRPWRDERGWMIGYQCNLERQWDRIDRELAVSENLAEQLLRERVQLIEGLLDAYVRVHLKQHEFDALCVHFYFDQELAMMPHCETLRRLNSGDRNGAACEMLSDVIRDQVYIGMLRRRAAEARLLLGGNGG